MATPKAALRRLRKLGIYRVVAVANAAVLYRDPAEADAELLRLRTQEAESLAAVVTVCPALPGWERDLERALQSGAAGVRLLPSYHGYSLLSGLVRQTLALLTDNGVPLVLPLRVEDERHQHPACTVPALTPDTVLQWLGSVKPQIPIVLQMGRFEEWRRIARELGKDAPVYFDLSFVNGPDGALETLADLVTPARLLFGTRFPLQYPEAKLEQLVLADLAEEDKQMIGQRNAEALFFHRGEQGR
ncbi:MAG: amidohydrolase [candidate division KSB1 bacterium]|nr:amidohydrolase [candidate division KSB1 bacterium]